MATSALDAGPDLVRPTQGQQPLRLEIRRLDARAFERFRGDPRRISWIVAARTKHLLIGYADFHPPLGDDMPWYLDSVAVEPQRQAAGIGTALVLRGLAWTAEGGPALVRARALVTSEEARRRRWLLRLGGVEQDDCSVLIDVAAGRTQPGRAAPAGVRHNAVGDTDRQGER